MNRRSALTVASSAGVAGLAGCLGLLEDGDSTADDGSDDERTGYDFGDVAPWFAAPEAFDPGRFFLTAQAPTLLAADDEAPSEIVGDFADPFADAAIQAPAQSDVDYLVTGGFGPRARELVASGSFDVATVAESLSDAGF